MAAKKKEAQRAVARRVEPEFEEIPTVVRVTAVAKGFDGMLIRNIGETFDMNVKSFEPAPTEEQEKDAKDLTAKEKQQRQQRLDQFDVIDVAGKEYLLPTWVKLAGEGEDVSEAKGHPKVAEPASKSVI